jgi:choline/glycine/proline betaine transport protein
MADWKKQLGRLLGGARPEPPLHAEDVRAFLRDVARPALDEIAEELRHRGRQAHLEAADDHVVISILDGDSPEFEYAIRARNLFKPGFAVGALTAEKPFQRAQVYLNGEAQDYGIGRYSKEQVIHHFLHEYELHVRWQKGSDEMDC